MAKKGSVSHSKSRFIYCLSMRNLLIICVKSWTSVALVINHAANENSELIECEPWNVKVPEVSCEKVFPA